MFSRRFRTFSWVTALSLLWLVPAIGQQALIKPGARTEPAAPTEPAAKLLLDRLGDFTSSGPVDNFPMWLAKDEIQRDRVSSYAIRHYISRDGRRISVFMITASDDSGAYAQFTKKRLEASSSKDTNYYAGIGTASYSYWDGKRNHLFFFKGRVSAELKDDALSQDSQPLVDLARMLSEPIDKGSGEIPVLVKHLPDWENEQSQVFYAVSKERLETVVPNQLVLNVLNFEGGAEAAVARYGPQTLAIVEFNTASLATDNDQRIKAKLQELGTQGLPVPTAYRRVGNYSVFVFDAPSAEAANQLIDQVKYQQVVQWLGRNPFAHEQATREFTETTLGVLVSVVQTSGLALVGCLAVGGLFGALLFRSRRAQQRAREAYADSDAMLRLNLDELTKENDPARLLGRGN